MAIIKIDLDKCTGCGMCVDNCGGEVLELQQVGRRKKSVAVRPDNCIYCLNCMDNCDYDAIKVYTPEGNPAWTVLVEARK